MNKHGRKAPVECRTAGSDGFHMESSDPPVDCWASPTNPQAPPTFPHETATSGRPSGPQTLPFGWKAAAHLSTVLGFRYANSTLVRCHQQQHLIVMTVTKDSLLRLNRSDVDKEDSLENSNWFDFHRRSQLRNPIPLWLPNLRPEVPMVPRCSHFDDYVDGLLDLFIRQNWLQNPNCLCKLY